MSTARRKCQKCGVARTANQYVSARGRICLRCQKTNRTAQVRKLHLERTYGLTQAQYDAILDYQDGACYGCKGTRRYNLHVDHDHKTGLVRGLLCASCNKILGLVRDRIEVLDALATYLEFPPAARLSIIVVAPEQPPRPRGRRRWAARNLIP